MTWKIIVFDPFRQAVFLVGGDKSGSWRTWYRTAIPLAEAAYVEHLRIEKGQLTRSEVDTLAAYVNALGGQLKIVADFGDESYVLG